MHSVTIVFHEGWVVAAVLLVDFFTTVFFVVDDFEAFALGAFTTGDEAVLEDILV